MVKSQMTVLIKRVKLWGSMLKIIATLHRKSGMSKEVFLKHWREVHVPLVASLPHLKGYVINPLIGTLDEEQACDGIAELWYSDRDAFEKSMASPEREAARADLVNFTDLTRMTRSIVEEERIV